MFQEEKPPEEIAKWSENVEQRLKVADQEMTKIVGWFNEIKSRKEEKEAQKKLEERQRQQEETLQLEMKIQQLKLETAAKLQSTVAQGTPQVQTSRLRKMEIRQFNGNKVDWPRFWSQFVENVEKN